MLRRARLTTPLISRPLYHLPKRGIITCPIINNILGHSLEITAVAAYTPAALAYSPLCTVALVGLSYHVACGGMKYTWFITELAVRDYIQDNVLQCVLRYIMMLTLMFCYINMFIEV